MGQRSPGRAWEALARGNAREACALRACKTSPCRGMAVQSCCPSQSPLQSAPGFSMLFQGAWDQQGRFRHPFPPAKPGAPGKAGLWHRILHPAPPSPPSKLGIPWAWPLTRAPRHPTLSRLRTRFSFLARRTQAQCWAERGFGQKQVIKHSAKFHSVLRV